ncbi:glycosyl transferase [Burkholderiales bacterium JOSHI_001]|nr:glycosyl transferase [Burkholderiales bacterium JOSHI_001]
MYKHQRIAVVVPAYNEETQITRVVETMPAIVDKIVIVNDASRDRTVEVVKSLMATHARVELIDLVQNQGVGGAIAAGYKWCRDNDMDVAVVMAGDGQMAPEDFVPVIEPVVAGGFDYSKGNRLFTGEAFKKIPRVRFIGNSILSLLTKIASGYWHVADSQTGYTAINRRALQAVDWDLMYKRYGQPNDLLVRLNVENMHVTDVPIEPVYNIGEKSGIKVRKVVFTIGWLLVRMFAWRLKEKYFIRTFHPLLFFYGFGALMCLVALLFGGRAVTLWALRGTMPEISVLLTVFAASVGFNSLGFAFWFDYEANKELAKPRP